MAMETYPTHRVSNRQTVWRPKTFQSAGSPANPTWRPPGMTSSTFRKCHLLPGVVHQWLSEADRSGPNPSRIPGCLSLDSAFTPDRLPETFGHLAQKFDVVEPEREQQKCTADGDRLNPTCEA
ncbi:hypothetical protein QBC45DRAFT_234018 [Copromyces sp. CBS 386.78]|nr:hypothetical protein QBC45DRAFT_234018 [Copromyces sp. CBS 386.78]